MTRRCRLDLPYRLFKRGACPGVGRFYHAFVSIFCPHPPDPLPPSGGRGRFLAFLCKGLRPLQPCVRAGNGTACRAVCGAGRGGCAPVPGRPSELRFREGDLRHAISGLPRPRINLLPPSPRPPSPLGKGEIFSFLMQGAAAPCNPASAPGTALPAGRFAVPEGVPVSCRLRLVLTARKPSAPIPPTRARRALFPLRGKGEFFS